MTDKTASHSLPEGALPVLPLRDVVVFPHMVIPLFVGREKSIKALEVAMEGDKRILLVAQTSPDIDDPAQGDLYGVGALAQVLQLLKLPDGTIKVLVEGTGRVGVSGVESHDGALYGVSHPLPQPAERDVQEVEALSRSLTGLFEQYLKTNRKLPPELMQTLQTLDDPARIADSIAAHLSVRLSDKQKLLETVDVGERLELLIGLVDGELDVQQLEKKIRGRVKSQMEKSQREYYLNEQMKAIQKELGEAEGEGGNGNELDALGKKIADAGMPKAVEAKAKAEYAKLRQMSPMSAEAGVVRNYLDWLLGVPWKKKSKVRKDLKVAQEVLDADHFGLDKVKDRILEYLAVQSRVSKMKGPILCLVGPPGVGKTSLGQSIAKATNRKFVRMALGGVRDEAEIRGHRRTYVGSMPGRIVQNLNKTGTRNPLFVLDEIDKMAMDFRGDPSSALLEVLDPEQNHAFNDHYLEVDLDLSEVMFIATSNSMNIPGPLLDRMEVIRIPGYTEEEKLNIAMRYLVPKQMKANGLRDGELKIDASAVQDIVRYYTRESGVRNLEREIARICRKVVKEIALAGPQPQKGKRKPKTVVVNADNLDKYLSVRRFDYGRAEAANEIGMVTGLAWTEVGGDLLQIESALVPGKGAMILTGQLGDVMKESASAALSVVRSRAERLGIEHDFLQKFDIHLHVPDGATPKDGPSAGAAMTTALVSSLTKIPVRADVAMTGEITLRGRVTAIGGLKEKLLAALRGGIKTVLIPDENRKDLVDLPKSVTEGMKIVPVKWIDEVLDLALERPITPRETASAEATLPVPPAELPVSPAVRRRRESTKERGVNH